MSLVTIIAKENFITVMSDGRVINPVNEEIIREDFMKMTAIGNNYFIAAVGSHKEVCDIILTKLNFLFKPDNDFKKIMIEIVKLCEDLNPNLNVNVSIAFGGINKYNEVEIYMYNTREKKENHAKPSKENLSFINLSPNMQENLDISELLYDYAQKNPLNTAKDCLKAQKYLNNYVSEKSISVNNNTFELIIEI